MRYLVGFWWFSRRRAVLVSALAACGGSSGDDESEEGGSTTIAGMKAELHGTKDVSGETGKVEIEMDDDYFEPTILKGTPGQTVTLELKNEGNNPHTLTISDQGVDTGSPAGRRGRSGRHVPADAGSWPSSAGSTRATAWSARSKPRAVLPGHDDAHHDVVLGLLNRRGSIYSGSSTIALPPPRRCGSAAASTRPPPRNSMPVAAPISAVVENP